MRDKVQVIGFPMGGEEVCLTDGRASRIELGTYAQGGTELLNIQVTAPINPGNSGGPAIKPGTNEVLGVAFQGYDIGDALGYIIPAPVLRHFAEEATSD